MTRTLLTHTIEVVLDDPAEIERWTKTLEVLDEVSAERKRQVEKWGVQHHRDGTGGPGTKAVADIARRITDLAADKDETSWQMILAEEVYEAFAESDPDKLRVELVQVAAVAASWIEDIDSRGEGT